MAKHQPNPYFEFQHFTIYHDKCAMKVGTDGVLLGAWADVANATSALDIGTGTGLIALMLAQRNRLMTIDAIDIDIEATVQATENIERTYFSSQIKVSHTSLQNLITDKKYDLIVSNPPFFVDSLESPDIQRTLARHTKSLSAIELIDSASRLISNVGRLCLIYPFEYKDDLLRVGKEYNLYTTRITNVYPTLKSNPKRILIELSKIQKTISENDLIIEYERHQYSPEFSQLVKEFYLKL